MRIEDYLTLWLPLKIDLDYHVAGEILPSQRDVVTPAITDININNMRIVDAEGHSFRLLGKAGATESLILGALREFLIAKGLTLDDVEEVSLHDVAAGLAGLARKPGRGM